MAAFSHPLRRKKDMTPQMQNNDSLVVPFFKSIAVQDEAASRAAGRPIFRDREVVEIRIAGERNFAPVVPAHSMWRREGGSEITYAQRWPDAYARFQEGREQVASGTPLSELPFLTEAKRQELRSLKVYTAEALASLDGKNLANLGTQGREYKTQAAAYLERAQGSARDVALAAEVEALKAQIAEMQSAAPDDEKEQIKAQIAQITGQRPRGNPSVETLREMLSELTSEA